MIVYLSGPITGVKDYERLFAEAEAELNRQGHVVLNPAMLPPDLGDCDTYMKICLPMIDIADVVVMLDGWKDSRGACREWGYAMGLDKLIIDLKDMEERTDEQESNDITASGGKNSRGNYSYKRKGNIIP